jgi:hypothetical protein
MSHGVSIAIAAGLLAFQGVSMSAPEMELRLGRFAALQANIQTEAQLRRVFGPDAGEIVRDVISRFPILGQKNRPEPRTVRVVAEQLPAEWLPRVEGVEFQRLSVKSETWKADCERVLWLEARREGDGLEVNVQAGNECRHTLQMFAYDHDGQRWQAAPGKRGGGQGGADHCTCP